MFCAERKRRRLTQPSLLCARTPPAAPQLVPQFHLYVSEASPPPSGLIEFRRDRTLARFKLGYLVVSVTWLFCLRPSHAFRPIRVDAATSKPKPALKNLQPGGHFSICQPLSKLGPACVRAPLKEFGRFSHFHFVHRPLTNLGSQPLVPHYHECAPSASCRRPVQTRRWTIFGGRNHHRMDTGRLRGGASTPLLTLRLLDTGSLMIDRQACHLGSIPLSSGEQTSPIGMCNVMMH